MRKKVQYLLVFFTITLLTFGITQNNKVSAASYNFNNLGTWATVGNGYTTSGGIIKSRPML